MNPHVSSSSSDEKFCLDISPIWALVIEEEVRKLHLHPVQLYGNVPCYVGTVHESNLFHTNWYWFICSYVLIGTSI
jgi:hypothetical protein